MRVIYILVISFLSSFAVAQKATLSGKVTEYSSGEPLMGVSITLEREGDLKGIVSNEYGFYSIPASLGTYRATFSYIGFETKTIEIDFRGDIRKDIFLVQKIESLTEVVLAERKNVISLKSPQMSKNILTKGLIKRIPTAWGEADVIQALLFLPGVSNTGEISTGFNVRGGGTDQNLILLDEAIVFTSSHLLGLASIFNSDVIRDITLYKGGVPANYGGRISSVLEVYQKEGNNKAFHGGVNIGSLSFSGYLEGPIKKDVGSFLVAYRVMPSYLYEMDGLSVGFYDLNTKLSYELDKNNKIYLSGYFGRDKIRIEKLLDNSYGNSSINLRWNHIFGSRLFSNLSAIYSDYKYALNFDLIDTSALIWNTGIKNFNLKYDFKHYLNDRLKLHYGLNNVYYIFNSGDIRPSSDKSIIVPKKLSDKSANELSIYIGAEHKLSDNLRVNVGIRLSRFDRFGSKIDAYENNRPVLYDESLKIYYGATPTTTTYESIRFIAEYTNIEPRASLAYSFGDNAVKLSYNRMTQYLQVINNNSSATPFDVWEPVGSFIKPMLLDQYAIGFSKKIDNTYTFEVEAYYKDIENKIDYIDGANLILNDNLEQVILNGKARSYGLELLVKKDLGKFTGLLSYTISKAEQQIAGRTPSEEGIENGDWYNSPQNKVHDFSFTGSYKYNEKWSFNTSFIFQTGRSTTYPVGQYQYLGYIVPRYGHRNEDRLPNYHRLDISAELTPVKKNAKKNYKVKWIFGVYNLYFAKNAYAISFENKGGENKAVRTSILPILPSITYNITF